MISHQLYECKKWCKDVNIARLFKEGAVSLVIDQGYNLIEAAKSLGIRVNMLSKWKQNLETENLVK